MFIVSENALWSHIPRVQFKAPAASTQMVGSVEDGK